MPTGGWPAESVNGAETRNFVASGAIGPCLVTPDEVVEPQALRLQARINGELRAQGSTSEQQFSAAALISHLSTFLVLQPGDVIATGPLADPLAEPERLAPGDEVEIEVSDLGTLSNPVTASS